MKTFLRLLAFLKPFMGSVLLSILLGVITVLSGIGLFGTSAYLIASAALHPSIAVLGVAIVGVRFFGIARGVFRYLERLVTHSVNFTLLGNLRVWFYTKIEPLAPAGLGKLFSGDLLSRAAADIETLENYYVRIVAPPITALIIMAAVWGFTGQYTTGLAWILTGGMVLSGTLVPCLAYFASRRPAKEWIEARGLLFTSMVEGVQGIEELLANNQVEPYLEGVQKDVLHARRSQIRLAWANGLANSLNILLPNLTLWLLLVAAIPLVNEGRLDGVMLVVIFMVGTASFEAIIPLGAAGHTFETTMHAARRIFSITDTQPIVTDPAIPRSLPESVALSIRGLSFRYSAETPYVLEDISFELPPRKKVALVGPSGSGKTTLTSLLLRFWDCPYGTILLNGQDICNFRLADVRANIALLHDPVYLFSGTVRQNLLLACPGASQANLEVAIATAGLGEWFDNLPHNWETWLGEGGLQVSSGERQRLGIARLTLQDAPLFILDEPVSRMDAISAQRMTRMIKNAAIGKSALWITHHLIDLEDMDEILVLVKGRLVERGIHDRLLQEKGVYWRMWSIQQRFNEDGDW